MQSKALSKKTTDATSLGWPTPEIMVATDATASANKKLKTAREEAGVEWGWCLSIHLSEFYV